MLQCNIKSLQAGRNGCFRLLFGNEGSLGRLTDIARNSVGEFARGHGDKGRYKIHWVILLCGLIYGFLKILSELIKHRDSPVTIGMVTIAFLGALWFFIYIKLSIYLKPKMEEKLGFGCTGCLVAILWNACVFLLPMVLWHLAFWLMGLLGLLPYYEVKNFVLLAL